MVTGGFVAEGIAAAAAWLATLWPVALVLAAIALVAAGVYLVIRNWDKIKAFFTRMWGAVAKAAKDFWAHLKGFIAKWGVEILVAAAPFLAWPLLVIKHWNVIGPAMRRIWDGAKAIVRNAITAIIGFVRSLPAKDARRAQEPRLDHQGTHRQGARGPEEPEPLPAPQPLARRQRARRSEGHRQHLRRPLHDQRASAQARHPRRTRARRQRLRAPARGGAQHVHVYLDGRELNRGLAKVARQSSRSGAR